MRREIEELRKEILADTSEKARRRSTCAFDESIDGRRDRIVLFGCGNMGRRILARLRNDGIYPAAFSDNDEQSWSRTIDDIQVLSPSDAASRFGANGVFIVTIYNPYCSFHRIAAQLSALGCSRILSVIPVRWKYHAGLLPYLRDDLPEKVLFERDSLLRAAELWADKPSGDIYLRQIHWRLFGDFDVLDAPELTTEYFPPDLVDLNDRETLVDCGAYGGDTIQSFVRACGGLFEAIHAVEPDPANLEELQHYVATLPEAQRTRITIHPVAAGSENTAVRFCSGQGLTSSIDPAGEIEVACRRLDDLLSGQRVTHLKLDIEGAEPRALIGASQIIAKQHPRIAVCLYHAQNHLWRIPLWIAENFPNYRLFLKAHSPDAWETIAYAL